MGRRGYPAEFRRRALDLVAAGKPVSRRALRSEGVTGSNQALNVLARQINAEQGGCDTDGDRSIRLTGDSRRGRNSACRR